MDASAARHPADPVGRSRREGGVVRPISRASGRTCSRPGCPGPATVTLTFRYDSRQAWLLPLAADPSPATYDLCGGHAAKTRPPHGWELVDERPPEPGERPAMMGSHEETVAVLAAALRPSLETPPSTGTGDVPETAPQGRELSAETDVSEGSSPALGPSSADTADLERSVSPDTEEVPEARSFPSSQQLAEPAPARASVELLPDAWLDAEAGEPEVWTAFSEPTEDGSMGDLVALLEQAAEQLERGQIALPFDLRDDSPREPAEGAADPTDTAAQLW